MNNLLDTHSFLWYIEGDKQLSANARKAIEADDANNFINIASLWEISIKISLGKLELKSHFSKVAELIENNAFYILPVSFEDTLILSGLPFYHRDPFDRMIIAQAITNNLYTITTDKNFSAYPVKIIW